MRNVLSCLIVCLCVSSIHAQYAGGMGEPNDPYLIQTAEQMKALGDEPNDWGKHFKLTADIDLRGYRDNEFHIIGYSRAWPDYRPFTGSFDGNGRKIVGFSCHCADQDCVGLFGCVAGYSGSGVPGTGIRNLTLVDPNVDAGTGNHVGALVGQFRDAVIEGCSVEGGSVSGGQYVGGLVGSTVETSILSYDVWLTIENCRASANVSGTGKVGGLIGYYSGYWHHTDEKRYEILACCAAGEVLGDEEVGGLVGAVRGARVLNCYAWGSVQGQRLVGGLIGLNHATVDRCYSTGIVAGGTDVGGLVGSATADAWPNLDEDGQTTTSFWDAQTSGQSQSSGGAGKTTAEMQTARTFLDAGWDFLAERGNGTEDTWWILEGRDYPRLWWEKVLGDDFADGQAEPQWMVYEIDPELVQIREVNGRLEASASAEAQNVDAFYVSDTWRLDVTKDFAIRVDYHFSKQGGGDGRVTIGLVPSLDLEAMQWAEFEVGCFESGPFYLYELRDGYWVQEQTSERSADDGTLFVSYNPAADELYFSHMGYGKPNAWRTATGLLAGRWSSEPVYVILGGGSEGLAFTGSEAWLDRFAIQAGVILQGSTHLATQSTAHTSHEAQVGSFNLVNSTRIPKAILGNDLKVYN